jgi:hypothetical protein
MSVYLSCFVHNFICHSMLMLFYKKKYSFIHSKRNISIHHLMILLKNINIQKKIFYHKRATTNTPHSHAFTTTWRWPLTNRDTNSTVTRHYTASVWIGPSTTNWLLWTNSWHITSGWTVIKTCPADNIKLFRTIVSQVEVGNILLDSVYNVSGKI